MFVYLWKIWELGDDEYQLIAANCLDDALKLGKLKNPAVNTGKIVYAGRKGE